MASLGKEPEVSGTNLAVVGGPIVGPHSHPCHPQLRGTGKQDDQPVARPGWEDACGSAAAGGREAVTLLRAALSAQLTVTWTILALRGTRTTTTVRPALRFRHRAQPQRQSTGTLRGPSHHRNGTSSAPPRHSDARDTIHATANLALARPPLGDASRCSHSTNYGVPLPSLQRVSALPRQPGICRVADGCELRCGFCCAVPWRYPKRHYRYGSSGMPCFSGTD